MENKNVEKLHDYLNTLQFINGGYNGSDITIIAKKFGITPKALRYHIGKLKKIDNGFRKFETISKRTGSIRFDEIEFVERELKRNCLTSKNYLVNKINSQRKSRLQKELPTSSIYYQIDKILKSLGIDEKYPYRWLKQKGINVSGEYNLEEARRSIKELFDITDLSITGIDDLIIVVNRINLCMSWMDKNYMGLDKNLLTYAKEIWPRRKNLRYLLSTVPSDQTPEIQSKLIFEIQIISIIEIRDFLIERLILENKRLARERSENISDADNEVLNGINQKYISLCESHIQGKTNEDQFEKEYQKIKSIDKKTITHFQLIRRQKERFDNIYKILKQLTNSFSTSDLKAHDKFGEQLLKIIQNQEQWHNLNDNDLKFLAGKESRLSILKSDEGLIKAKLVNRLMDYMQDGRTTVINSMNYQDFSPLIVNINVDKNPYHLNDSNLNELLSNKFKIDLTPLKIDRGQTYLSDFTECEKSPNKRIPFKTILDTVKDQILKSNPNWFEKHLEVYYKSTDYMFDIEYNQKDFLEKSFDSLWLMGLNTQYRTSKEYQNLKYFIYRYMNKEAIMLWHYLIFNTLLKLNKKINVGVIILDTMAFQFRQIGIYSDLDWRHRIIGGGDYRAILSNMFSVYSDNIKATDTEAMNITLVLSHVIGKLDAKITLYVGDGRTVSYFSAAVAFLTYGVAAAGRKQGEPKKLIMQQESRLLQNKDNLKRVGVFLTENPELGRAISSRKYIYLNGINIRAVLKDFGNVVLLNVGRHNPKISDLCQRIEKSHHLKCLWRAYYGKVTKFTITLLQKI